MSIRKITASFCAVAVATLALSACAAPDDKVAIANADHSASQTSATSPTSTATTESTPTSETTSSTAETTTEVASDTPDLAKASAYCKKTVDPKQYSWDEFRLVADGTSLVFDAQFDTDTRRPIKIQTPTYPHWVDRAKNGKLRVDGMYEDGSPALPWPISRQVKDLYNDWNRIVHEARDGTRQVPEC